MARRIIPPDLLRQIFELLVVDFGLRHIDIEQRVADGEKIEGIVRNVVSNLAAVVPAWLSTPQLVEKVMDLLLE